MKTRKFAHILAELEQAFEVHRNAGTPAGYTDLLVSYTYRIAFEGGGGQDFGLAAAIATLIFLLVGLLAIVNLKATRMKFD